MSLKEYMDFKNSEMYKHFVERTNKHIGLVKEYAKKISLKFPGYGSVVKQADKHDENKFSTEAAEPYSWLTWRYKLKGEGKDCVLPEGMETRIKKATKQHILTNRHHPEYHIGSDNLKESAMDASSMTDIDIAEMVADWCAMSKELGGSPLEWSRGVVNKKWNFTPEQTQLIEKLIKGIWND